MVNELIGNLDAICPNCSEHLDKKPGRKKKCPHCGKFIFVRTRPSDRQRVLVTQDQAEQIEEQWSIVDGTHSEYVAKKKRFLEAKARLTKIIGNTAAICPYCDQSLDKMPGRKKKCQNCGCLILVVVRPNDEKHVLATEDQAEQIEEQWSIVHGTHEQYLAKKKRFAEAKARLAERFGKEPSDNDVKWSLLNDDLLENAARNDWGFFRNTKFEMAEILRKEARLLNALETYLEVCYLDLNGPSNAGGWDDPDLIKEFPPWDPKHLAFLAPGVVGLVAVIIGETGATQGDIEAVFMRRAAKLEENLRLPVSASKAWGKLKKELF